MPHSHSHADLLDLDAEVFAGCLSELADVAVRLAPPEVRTVVDLGAGTGLGARALAARFPAAEVVAVDRTAELLRPADRVRPVVADMDDGWPAPVGRADVVWASSSLHEVADPDRLLRGIVSALRPGGLLVVVEIDGLPQVLPSDVGDGAGARATAALLDAGWNAHPDWTPHLEAAGFSDVERRTVVSTSSASPETTARYARAWLHRVRHGVEGRLAADDLAVLDAVLADPDAAVAVRGARTAWTARRPLVSSGGPR